MNKSEDDLSFDEKLNKTLASNQETQKEIERVLASIEETKKKKDTVFKSLGITPEMQKENLSPSDLSSGQKKIFDVLEKEFVAELSAKGLEIEPKTTKQSKANLTLSRKRLRI